MKEFLAGILVGIIIAAALSELGPTSYYNVVTNAKESCEKSLPRDEHCVIVAIPVSKD